MKLEQVSALGEPSNGQQPIGLMDFAHKLAQKMKGYKTAISDKGSPNNMLYVHREGDNYVMGIIGYGDFQTSGDGNDRFAVWSPNISNMKYSHGMQQNMSLAVNMDKAVKNATKYLRPLSMEQTMKLSLRDCSRAADNVVDNIRSNTGEFRVHTDVDASTHYSFTMFPDNTSMYDQHNLPDELAGKLSVLSMLESEGYVEGVGYRAANNIFYLRGE